MANEYTGFAKPHKLRLGAAFPGTRRASTGSVSNPKSLGKPKLSSQPAPRRVKA